MKMSRFLWKIGLLGLSSKKCSFCMQNSWSSTLKACIEIYVLRQIIIDIMILGYKQNINLELHKTFFQEFFQSMMANDSAKMLIEACGDDNFI